MKLTVLGATGSVGRELLTQALAAGHEVTALVREQPNSGEIDERVALVVGDAASAAAVERAVRGSDAVVSTLGHAKGSPDSVLAQASASMIAAMRADGVDRLVVLSSPAVADTEDRPGLFYRATRILLRIVMPRVVRDHEEQAHLIEESGLAWTIVRGATLVHRRSAHRPLPGRADRAAKQPPDLPRRPGRLHARSRNRPSLHSDEAARQPVEDRDAAPLRHACGDSANESEVLRIRLRRPRMDHSELMNVLERIRRFLRPRPHSERLPTEEELEDQRATAARTHEVGLVFKHPVPGDELGDAPRRNVDD